jgi:formylglycine-generating enzyme required for sulfatase activity
MTFQFVPVLVCALALLNPLHAELPANTPPGMARVPGGVYRPLFRGDSDAKEFPVKAFVLDIHPVTNAEFLDFVRANPRWRRSQVKRLFADENYLKHWAGDLELGDAITTNAPVTWVSWFAAKAFAAWAGKRLLCLPM